MQKKLKRETITVIDEDESRTDDDVATEIAQLRELETTANTET